MITGDDSVALVGIDENYDVPALTGENAMQVWQLKQLNEQEKMQCM